MNADRLPDDGPLARGRQPAETEASLIVTVLGQLAVAQALLGGRPVPSAPADDMDQVADPIPPGAGIAAAALDHPQAAVIELDRRLCRIHGLRQFQNVLFVQRRLTLRQISKSRHGPSLAITRAALS